MIEKLSPEQKIHNLENEVKYLHEKIEKMKISFDSIVEFHKLEIPLRYTFSGYYEGKSGLFRCKNSSIYSAKLILNGRKTQTLELPKDPKEYELSKARMREYLLEKDKITQTYYKMFAYNSDWSYETTDLEEAKRLVEEGGKWYSEMDDGTKLEFNEREFCTNYKRVLPKPDYSEIQDA